MLTFYCNSWLLEHFCEICEINLDFVYLKMGNNCGFCVLELEKTQTVKLVRILSVWWYAKDQVVTPLLPLSLFELIKRIRGTIESVDVMTSDRAGLLNLCLPCYSWDSYIKHVALR